ncbi:MAG: hypothetical protein HQL59_01230 [Magnetococcales bacterium]|nr:hypothetical protein [Magnetococcales bacterium]
MTTGKRQLKALLEAWERLGDSERESVVHFARFLSASCPPIPESSVPEAPVLQAPVPGETAIQALKRLKRGYPMIEADSQLLDAASRLVMERMFGGEEAAVIARMEALFAGRYREWAELRSVNGGGAGNGV